MLSQASVILSMGEGVYTSMEWAGGMYIPGRTLAWVAPPRWPLKRTVRILLEYILNDIFACVCEGSATGGSNGRCKQTRSSF